LFRKNLDRVRVKMQNLGASNLQDKWVKVRVNEDSFLLQEKFWDPNCSWREFLDYKKIKWPVLERFVNISFFNEELKDLQLCLNAPKLDAKWASVQLLGAYFLASLPSDLVDADFIVRGRLNDAITNWLATQSLYKSMQASYEKYGKEIPYDFCDHIEATRVIGSFLFVEVKNWTEDFFRTRKACSNKVFTSCASNQRADMLRKFSPFSALLFEQGVIDTILVELRTEEKVPGMAFGKKSVPDKSCTWSG